MTMMVTFLLAGVTAEVSCRLFLAPTRHWLFPPGMYQDDSDRFISYRLTPNHDALVQTPYVSFHVRTNSLGFRGPEPDMTGGHKTIAAIGDSFTFGQGVDETETFPAVMAASIDAKKWQVVNAGTTGYSPAQEYRRYRELNAKMRLDVVIIQLCENDVLDQSKPTEQGLFNGTLVRHRPKNRWELFKAIIIDNSELAARARLFTEQVAIMRGDIQPYMLSTFEQLRAPEIQSTTDLLRTWITEAKSLNQRVLLVYTPIHMQVEPGFQGYLDRFRKQGRPVDLDAAHRWLTDFLKDEPTVTYVDVVTPLREKAKAGQSLFLTGDTHNNPLGNQIIAQELLKALAPSL